MMTSFNDYFDYSQEILLEESFVRVEETYLHEVNSNGTRSVMVMFIAAFLYYLYKIIKKASDKDIGVIVFGMIMLFLIW